MAVSPLVSMSPARFTHFTQITYSTYFDGMKAVITGRNQSSKTPSQAESARFRTNFA